MEECLCWHLAIFTGRHQPTIVATTELNFCVRYGNRWTLSVIDTNYLTFLLTYFIQITIIYSLRLVVTRGGIDQMLRICLLALKCFAPLS